MWNGTISNTSPDSIHDSPGRTNCASFPQERACTRCTLLAPSRTRARSRTYTHSQGHCAAFLLRLDVPQVAAVYQLGGERPSLIQTAASGTCTPFSTAVVQHTFRCCTCRTGDVTPGRTTQSETTRVSMSRLHLHITATL